MGKGKVHPSPSLPAAAPAGGGGGGEMTAEAVLMRLLPAVVLAAAAPLGAEGKEVLAYLVLASLRSSAPPTPARGEGEARAHRPELGCGCFGCYTAYWSRWDGSPEADREAIHRAIEAFEEHLAKKEEEEGAGGKGRKKRTAAAKGKDKAGKGKGKEVAVDLTPPPLPLAPPAVLPVPEDPAKVEEVAEEFKALEEEEVEKEDATTSAADEEAASASGGEEEKRRRGWGAVLSWRNWGLWGSH